jgi:hypothetical protein
MRSKVAATLFGEFVAESRPFCVVVIDHVDELALCTREDANLHYWLILVNIASAESSESFPASKASMRDSASAFHASA